MISRRKRKPHELNIGKISRDSSGFRIDVFYDGESIYNVSRITGNILKIFTI